MNLVILLHANSKAATHIAAFVLCEQPERSSPVSLRFFRVALLLSHC